MKMIPLILCILLSSVTGWAKDISELNQHFNQPGEPLAPWTFQPEKNIKDLSTSEHPGLLMIKPADKQQDVKGVLEQPIRLDQYAAPWEFQLALAQNFDAMCGVRSKTQINYALGLNVAVTFSNPDSWPKDRQTRPEGTKEFQLLVVHLGHNAGGEGLPQFTHAPHPETYLVWGRGDLAENLTGDWQIPHVWVGDGSVYAGPASYQLYFRCSVLNETTLQIGIKFDASHGWNMRTVDCSRWGKITGIWEVGPIFSHDRWIPDVLCRALPKVRTHPIITGVDMAPDNFLAVQSYQFPQPQPEPPNPRYEDYVDYCVFLPGRPLPLEAYSDDFDIPGYLARWQIQPQSTYINSYINPGYLTMTLVGVGLGTGFGPVGGAEFDLTTYPPPWEIETAFIPPRSGPWNYYLSFVLYDQKNTQRGFWNPGLVSNGKDNRHDYVNMLGGKSLIDVQFDAPLPDEIATASPIYFLIQVLSTSQFRVGLKAKPEDHWYFSQPFDGQEALDGPVSRLGMGCWSTVTGRNWGGLPGSPMYQTFLIDYIKYRYGLTKQ